MTYHPKRDRVSCPQRKNAVNSQFSHGHATKDGRTKAYNCWRNIKKRCNLPTDRWYHRYGGRGIKVCERWMASYEDFLADMGPGAEGLSLDRINNDGDYCPENCRWATLKEQLNNTSRSRHITYNGETLTLTGWAERLNLTSVALHRRILAGWELSRALTTPK